MTPALWASFGTSLGISLAVTIVLVVVFWFAFNWKVAFDKAPAPSPTGLIQDRDNGMFGGN